MFCIGFGDVFPKTNVGKWVALVSMYTGVIFTYFMITLIGSYLKLDSHTNMFILDQKRTVNLFICLEKKTELRLVAHARLQQNIFVSVYGECGEIIKINILICLCMKRNL
jgi:hypothetical protein